MLTVARPPGVKGPQGGPPRQDEHRTGLGVPNGKSSRPLPAAREPRHALKPGRQSPIVSEHGRLTGHRQSPWLPTDATRPWPRRDVLNSDRERTDPARPGRSAATGFRSWRSWARVRTSRARAKCLPRGGRELPPPDRRVHESTTKARTGKRSRSANSMMSATHSRSGRSAVKARLTRSLRVSKADPGTGLRGSFALRFPPGQGSCISPPQGSPAEHTITSARCDSRFSRRGSASFAALPGLVLAGQKDLPRRASPGHTTSQG